MDIIKYIEPVRQEKNIDLPFKEDLLNSIDKFSDKFDNDDIKNYHITLLGVPEDRNSKNKGSAKAPDEIRKELYSLYKPFSRVKILDLGNLKKGKTVNDTYVALQELTEFLLSEKIIPVVFGGTADLNLPLYNAIKTVSKKIFYTNVDSRLGIGDDSTSFTDLSVLSEILKNKKNRPFNYTNIGAQAYYSSQRERDTVAEHNYDIVRVGKARSALHNTEPFFRDSNFASFNICSVKSSDAPGCDISPANGFYGEEICQLAKYAGSSNILNLFSLTGVNPKLDNKNKTLHLAAQIIWYFIQGYYIRKAENPTKNENRFKKIIITSEELNTDLIFYKSNMSGRYWTEIPYIYRKKEKKIIISCSFDEYQQALNNDIPERWWKFYKKLN